VPAVVIRIGVSPPRALRAMPQPTSDLAIA
jgi:hypothetical protein